MLNGMQRTPKENNHRKHVRTPWLTEVTVRWVLAENAIRINLGNDLIILLKDDQPKLFQCRLKIMLEYYGRDRYLISNIRPIDYLPPMQPTGYAKLTALIKNKLSEQGLNIGYTRREALLFEI